MAGAEDEAIAVGPLGRLGVVAQVVIQERGGKIGAAQRQARMAALGLFDAVDREAADRAREIDHQAAINRGNGQAGGAGRNSGH